MNFAKVMFLQVCVCQQGGRAWWQGGVCGGGGACVVAEGACVVAEGAMVVAGMHGGRGGHAWWQGGVRGVGGACVVGVCMVGRRHVWDTVNERAVGILLEYILVDI